MWVGACLNSRLLFNVTKPLARESIDRMHVRKDRLTFIEQCLFQAKRGEEAEEEAVRAARLDLRDLAGLSVVKLAARGLFLAQMAHPKDKLSDERRASAICMPKAARSHLLWPLERVSGKEISANLLRSDLKVPPYFGLLPIRSMISGIQEAKTAYNCAS